MGYPKTSYFKQICYIIGWKIRQIFKGDKKNGYIDSADRKTD